MVIPNLATEFYEELGAQYLEDIRILQASIAESAGVREMFPDDWEIEEACRNFIFDATQNIQGFMKGVEHAREARKELGRIPG